MLTIALIWGSDLTAKLLPLLAPPVPAAFGVAGQAGLAMACG